MKIELVPKRELITILEQAQMLMQRFGSRQNSRDSTGLTALWALEVVCLKPKDLIRVAEEGSKAFTDESRDTEEFANLRKQQSKDIAKSLYFRTRYTIDMRYSEHFMGAIEKNIPGILGECLRLLRGKSRHSKYISKKHK